MTQRDPDAGPLTADDILLTEDGAPRRITYFARPAAESDLGSLFSAGPSRTAVPVELTLLLNTTGGSALQDLWTPPGPLIIGSRFPPDPAPAFAAWLNNAFLDPLGNSWISVYGFDANLQRYCGPTRDAGEILAAIRGAEKGSRGEAVVLGPPSEVRGAAHIPMRWDSAIAATAQDALGEPEDAYRIILPVLRGLPADNWDPAGLAGLCRDLGITVYPMFRDLAWPSYARDSVAQGRSPSIVPAAPGLKWSKMSRPQRLAWIDTKEREFEDYKKLATETGGKADDPHLNLRTTMDDIVLQARWVYAAGFTPVAATGAPREHKLEVRLRDGKPAVVEGGTRSVVY